MTIEQQSQILRAMRAFLNLEQAAAAAGAEIAERTLLDAEKGRACSEKTWEKLTAFYAAHGLHWREGDQIEAGRILIARQGQS